jgi:hypothetical protein
VGCCVGTFCEEPLEQHDGGA